MPEPTVVIVVLIGVAIAFAAPAAPADIRAAGAFLRWLDLNLRAADALNIAIAQRV
jgi:hypothetical protein